MKFLTFDESVPRSARKIKEVVTVGGKGRLANGERLRMRAAGLMYCPLCDKAYLIEGLGGQGTYCKSCSAEKARQVRRSAGRPGHPERVRRQRDRREYYKEYYAKHADELAEKRKQREAERVARRAERARVQEREEFIQRTLKARAYDQPAEVLARLDAERDEGLRA